MSPITFSEASLAENVRTTLAEVVLCPEKPCKRDFLPHCETSNNKKKEKQAINTKFS